MMLLVVRPVVQQFNNAMAISGQRLTIDMFLVCQLSHRAECVAWKNGVYLIVGDTIMVRSVFATVLNEKKSRIQTAELKLNPLKLFIHNTVYLDKGPLLDIRWTTLLNRVFQRKTIGTPLALYILVRESCQISSPHSYCFSLAAPTEPKWGLATPDSYSKRKMVEIDHLRVLHINRGLHNNPVKCLDKIETICADYHGITPDTKPPN
eukprot:sb/3470388/